MTRHTVLPMIMGALMGLMMLGMVHQQLTKPDAQGFWALVLFAGAHVVLLTLALVLPLWAAHRMPRVRRVLDSLHKPNLRHILLMLGSASIVAALAHIVVHGVL